MKKAISLVLLLALILSFTACAYREPNAKFTVTAMGFEKNGSSVTAYLQAMDFSKGENKTFVSVGQGRDVSLALKDIKTTLSKEPSFEHCEIILLSKGIEKQQFEETLSLCNTLGMSQKTKIAYTANIGSALENKTIGSGGGIAALINENSRDFGFGKNTALFEIKTAILVNNGNFALVNLGASNNEIKFGGLMEYQNCKAVRLLSFDESRQYSKEHAK